jgi:hypothetical protein
MTRAERAAILELAGYFLRNGYVRHPNPRRQRTESTQSYKKGTEARLVANSAAELSRIRALLRQAGFHPGKAFRKGRRYRQPIYGSETVSRFLRLVRSVRGGR